MKSWFPYSRILLLVSVFFCFFISCDSGTASNTSTNPAPKEPEDFIGDFAITSSAFNHNDRLADKYCNFSSNISLPFEWVYPPNDVKSFALIMHDPDGEYWIHWAVFNIPKDCGSIIEGASRTKQMPIGSIELQNEFSTAGYGGPEPPAGTGTHRYTVTLYALNVPSIGGLSSSVFRDYSGVKSLLAGKIINQVEIIGTYSR